MREQSLRKFYGHGVEVGRVEMLYEAQRTENLHRTFCAPSNLIEIEVVCIGNCRYGSELLVSLKLDETTL